MTRPSLSAPNLAAAQQKTVRLAYLVRIEFPSGDLAMTTADRDIVYGGVTYRANGSFTGAGTVSEDASIRGRSVSVVFSGVDTYTTQKIRDDAYHFANVSMYVAYLDKDYELVDDPYPLMLYGKLSGCSLSVGSGGNTITATVEHRGVILNRRHTVMATRNFARLRNPDETGFDVIHLIESMELEWGGQTFYGYGGGEPIDIFGQWNRPRTRPQE